MKMILEQNRTEHMCLSRVLLSRHSEFLDDWHALMQSSRLGNGGFWSRDLSIYCEGNYSDKTKGGINEKRKSECELFKRLVFWQGF